MTQTMHQALCRDNLFHAGSRCFASDVSFIQVLRAVLSYGHGRVGLHSLQKYARQAECCFGFVGEPTEKGVPEGFEFGSRGLAVPTPACRCPRHCANFRKMACCFLVTLHRKDSCCEKASASRQQNTPNDPAKMWLGRKVPADRKTYRQAATRSCFGFMAFPSKPASS